jgi:hypothetical protein
LAELRPAPDDFPPNPWTGVSLSPSIWSYQPPFNQMMKDNTWRHVPVNGNLSFNDKNLVW